MKVETEMQGASPPATDRRLSLKSVATQFLDDIKAAGVVITNEEILRNGLLQGMTCETEGAQLAAVFLGWAEQGRKRGVTFHISAAGLNQIALAFAFVDARMMRSDVERFIRNLREEPAPEIGMNFSARAEC